VSERLQIRWLDKFNGAMKRPELGAIGPNRRMQKPPCEENIAVSTVNELFFEAKVKRT
jgi:hypothetical protein